MEQRMSSKKIEVYYKFIQDYICNFFFSLSFYVRKLFSNLHKLLHTIISSIIICI